MRRLSPLGRTSPREFMARHWQRRPLLVRGALRDSVPPLSRAELFALAARDGVESRLVRHTARGWSLEHGPFARSALPPLRQRAWTLLVASIDGTIDDYAPEALEEEEDIIERFPSMAGSREEDGVLLDSLVDDDIDAFTVFATPGAGMFVSAQLDGECGGPFLFWTDGGEVETSATEATELFPQ